MSNKQKKLPKNYINHNQEQPTSSKKETVKTVVALNWLISFRTNLYKQKLKAVSSSMTSVVEYHFGYTKLGWFLSKSD